MQYVSSVTNPYKRIYYDLKKSDNSETLVVFLSGFSGSRDFPFLQDMSQMFLGGDYSTLRLNFCTDSEDTVVYPDTLDLSEINFSVYRKELDNLLAYLCFKKYIFIGHSFGVPVCIDFLSYYPSFLEKSQVVFWEPSLLPWSRDTFFEFFTYDIETGLYVSNDKKEHLSAKFFNEIVTHDSAKQFSSLTTSVCIISAKGSCDNEAEQYITRAPINSHAEHIILENTDHCFQGVGIYETLFKKTLNYLKQSS